MYIYININNIHFFLIIQNILNSNQSLRNTAERQAVNTVCQGSSADLIKLAMINIHHRLSELSQNCNNSPVIPSNGTDINQKYSPMLKSLGPGFFFRQTRSYPGGGLYKVCI
jgi:hypothetical protein